MNERKTRQVERWKIMKTNKQNILKQTVAFISVTALLTSLASCTSTTANASKAETSTVEKADKTAPMISFVKDSVSVEAGTDYKMTDNIKSIKDDVDGEIKRVEKFEKNSAGYMIDESKVDLKTAGIT